MQVTYHIGIRQSPPEARLSQTGRYLAHFSLSLTRGEFPFPNYVHLGASLLRFHFAFPINLSDLHNILVNNLRSFCSHLQALLTLICLFFLLLSLFTSSQLFLYLHPQPLHLTREQLQH